MGKTKWRKNEVFFAEIWILVSTSWFIFYRWTSIIKIGCFVLNSWPVSIKLFLLFWIFTLKLWFLLFLWLWWFLRFFWSLWNSLYFELITDLTKLIVFHLIIIHNRRTKLIIIFFLHNPLLTIRHHIHFHRYFTYFHWQLFKYFINCLTNFMMKIIILWVLFKIF